MKNKKTVFIFGAGTGDGIGMPTGSDLKVDIAKLLSFTARGEGPLYTDGDKLLVGSFYIHAGRQTPSSENLKPYLEAAQIIRAAMPQAISIDNFIDTHSDNKTIELCGKLAIARGILLAEEKSNKDYLSERTSVYSLAFGRLKDTWLNRYFQFLTENCSIKELPDRLKSITLIIFNYDRCIEHFLYYSLQNYYRITPEHAATIVNDMNIYHPYGTVGSLPWQNANIPMEFGQQPDSPKLLSLTEQIRTFTEGTDNESSEILAIRKSILEARNAVFLGFAFHKLNLELLATNSASSQRSGHFSVYATAKNISESNREMIEKDLFGTKAEPRPCYLRQDLDCVKLIEEYWRRLSLA